MSQTDLKAAVERFGGTATKTAISNVERGDRMLKAEELVQWSIAMNTRPSMILTDRNPETVIELFPGLTTDSQRLRRFLEGRYPLNAGWRDLRRHRRTSVVFKTTFVRQVGTHYLCTCWQRSKRLPMPSPLGVSMKTVSMNS